MSQELPIIQNLPPKSTLDPGDLLIIADGADGYNLKNVDAALLLGNVIDILYADLETAISGALLFPGKYYRITDFQTVHNVPYTDDGTGIPIVNIGVSEPLIVFATDVGSIDKQAYSELYPHDTIYYSTNLDNTLDTTDVGFFNSGIQIAGLMGIITYREDTVQNVSTYYDFRNVKFRRWYLDFGSFNYNVGTTYGKYDFVHDPTGGITYISIQAGNVGNPLTDSTFWVPVWDAGVYDGYIVTNTISFNLFGHSIAIANNIYEDFLTFGDPVNYYWLRNVHLGLNNLPHNANTSQLVSRLNNIVFNTISTEGTLTDTTIENGTDCTIYTGFSYNQVGSDFSKNTIGSGCLNNRIGDFFYGNLWSGNDSGNITGFSYTGNFMGQISSGNSFRNSTSNNILGNFFEDNNIEIGFADNIIDINFIWNHTGEGFLGNWIGKHCYYNKFDDVFESAIILDDFQKCHIRSQSSLLATPLDFTLATLVYLPFDKTIYTRPDGTVKMSYMDDNDNLVVALPTD